MRKNNAFFESVFFDSAILKAKINLTRDELLCLNGIEYSGLKYSDKLVEFLSMYSDDSSSYSYDLISNEKLIMVYRMGDMTPVYYFNGKEKLFGYKQYKVFYYLSEEKNGDILGDVFVFDITDIMLEATRLKLRHGITETSERILDVLASEYLVVYYVDILNDKVIQYVVNPKYVDIINEKYCRIEKYSDVVKTFINSSVYVDDRSFIKDTCDMENLKKELKQKKSFSINFRSESEASLRYCEMKFIKSNDTYEDTQFVAIGLTDKDEEIVGQFVNEKLVSDYEGIYMVDLPHDTYRAFSKANYDISNGQMAGVYSEAIMRFAEKLDTDSKKLFENLSAPSKMSRYLGINDKREFTFKRLEGGSLWERCSIQVVEREGGIPATLILSFMRMDKEMAERMELDRALAIENEKLERQTTELEDAVETANRANRVKTAFLSNMSHDIRTPLNAIIGYATLAEEHSEDYPKVKNYHEKILSSGKHLLSLIDDILDMSRIESGKISIDKKSCNLNEMFSDINDIIRPQAENNSIRFRMNLSEIYHDRVIFDKLHTTQVLLNILSNAVKYTNPGGHVTMTARELETDVPYVSRYEFRVKDNGIGMSEGFVEHLWEPFTRERTSTDSGIKGTGLGMAISKSLIDMMGGDISIKTKEGKGSEFVINLCLELDMNINRPKEEPSVMTNDYDLKGKRILLAEDNELNREIATEFLQDEGFLVDSAVDGAECVEKLKKEKAGYYSMIIMDIQMPKMDGYEATGIIRRLKNRQKADIPIIAMSANAFDEDIAKSLKCGMNGHISKPINRDKLFTIIRKLIKA